MHPSQWLKLIGIIVLSFIAGWFSHQMLLPILPPDGDVPASIVSAPQREVSQVIYSATANTAEDPMRIYKVTVVQDTAPSLVLDVAYRYAGDPPAEEVKMYANVSNGPAYLGEFQVKKGSNTARMYIRIVESDMKKQELTMFETDAITFRFEHYPPGKYNGVLHKTIVPFKKNWSLSPP
ncbi:MAG: hypothetical protein V4805_11475 [Pseudomonadota bacterium]